MATPPLVIITYVPPGPHRLPAANRLTHANVHLSLLIIAETETVTGTATEATGPTEAIGLIEVIVATATAHALRMVAAARGAMVATSTMKAVET